MRAGRAGLLRSTPGFRADTAAPATSAVQGSAAPAGLSERRGACALYAAVFQARRLRARLDRRRGVDTHRAPAADAGRILGSRGEPGAGGGLAAAAKRGKAAWLVEELRQDHRPVAGRGRAGGG